MAYTRDSNVCLCFGILNAMEIPKHISYAMHTSSLTVGANLAT